MTTTAVAERQPRNNAEVLFALIEKATTESDFSVEKLTQLLDVKERWDREEARKAYVAALAQFKRNPPTIVKSETVDFTSKGGRTHYRYASLGNVADAVSAALADYGLSHSWAVDQEDGQVKVTCTLTHEQGHSEQVAIAGPHDGSGNKNGIQQIGSAITYLQRYTLMAITGLAAMDQDDDGQSVARNPASARGNPPSDQVSRILDNAAAELKRGNIEQAQISVDSAEGHPDADRHWERIAAAKDAIRNAASDEPEPGNEPIRACNCGTILTDDKATVCQNCADRAADDLFANLPDPGP